MPKDRFVFWGSLAGMVGAAAFMSLWMTAIIIDGHWIFGTETLSELGGDRPGRLFFNSAVIIMGTLTLVFASALYRRMGRSSAGRIAAMVFALSSALLIGVGIFPIDTGAPHTFFSWSFFSVVIASLTLMLIPCRQRTGPKSVGTLALMGVLIIAYGTIALVALNVIELGFSEALVVIALNVWEFINGASMLLDKGDRMVPCIV